MLVPRASVSLSERGTSAPPAELQLEMLRDRGSRVHAAPRAVQPLTPHRVRLSVPADPSRQRGSHLSGSDSGEKIRLCPGSLPSPQGWLPPAPPSPPPTHTHQKTIAFRCRPVHKIPFPLRKGEVCKGVFFPKAKHKPEGSGLRHVGSA